MGIAGGHRKRRQVARGIVARWIFFAATASLLGSLAAVVGALPASAAGEGTILTLVNEARASNGLGPLVLNGSMSAVSEAWANQMAANGAMTHNPNYSSQIPGGWSRAAENVAQGYGSPSAVHEGWMNSTGHRENILGDYTDIGIAFVSVGGTTWAVENFGKYGASVAAPAPAPPPAPPVAAPPPVAPAPVVAPPVAAPVPASPVPTVPASVAPTPVAPTPSTSAPGPGSPTSTALPEASAPVESATSFTVLVFLGGILAVFVVGTGTWTGLLLRRRWKS